MKKRILYGLLLATLCSGVAAQNPQGQTRIAKEERTRYVEDSLLAARLGVSIEKLRDSLRLMATKTYVIENYVTNTDSRLTDSRTPKGNAGGDLTGTYPNPTIKSSVALTGSPTAPTPAASTNSTRIATTAYVKSNLDNYVTTSDSRLTDSRNPTGTAGGDLTGTYPNPTIKSSVTLTGSPTAPTPAASTNSTRIATTAYVKSNLDNYVTTSDSRLTDSRNPTGTAGGDLTGTYPNPTIKSSVNLTGSPTAPTPAAFTNSTRIATTAYVKSNLANYVTTSDSRLTDSRNPTGTAGGDLTGAYPNPTIKSSVTLNGDPTITGNLRLKGSNNYGNKLNFGDGDYVYIYEETDDNLTIKANNINLNGSASISLNGVMKKRSSYTSDLTPSNITVSPGESIFINSHTGFAITIKYPTDNELNYNNVARIFIADGYISSLKVQSSAMTIYESSFSSEKLDYGILYEIYWITRNVVVVEYRPI